MVQGQDISEFAVQLQPCPNLMRFSEPKRNEVSNDREARTQLVAHNEYFILEPSNARDKVWSESESKLSLSPSSTLGCDKLENFRSFSVRFLMTFAFSAQVLINVIFMKIFGM